MRERHDRARLEAGMAHEQALRREPRLLRGYSRPEFCGNQAPCDRRERTEEPASRHERAHVSAYQGKATVKPAVPPQSSADRLIPWCRPTSSDSSCSGDGGSTSQTAPTRALFWASFSRTLSPFTSATPRSRR